MLKDRVAMITGPAKGMGAAITRAFVAEGCRLSCGRDTSAIEPLAAEIRAAGGQSSSSPATSTDAGQCEQAAKTGAAAFGGRIDILVNVAGGAGPIGKTGVETTPEEFDDIVTLNMNGCFHIMRAVLPVMIAQRYGKMVNVGGTFGMRGRAGRMAYSASKWGLRGITKSIAIEVGPYNINVNCVAPGMVDGERFRDKVCRDMAQQARHHRSGGRRTSRRRIRAEANSLDSDIANACLFLASDASRQITGADIPVDGGWASL